MLTSVDKCLSTFAFRTKIVESHTHTHTHTHRFSVLLKGHCYLITENSPVTPLKCRHNHATEISDQYNHLTETLAWQH